VSSGALIGLTIITATVLGVDSLRGSARAGQVGDSFYLLVGGTLAGILAAAFGCWVLLAPVGSAYRRGALSMVCAFATILLMLVCIPVHQLLGRIGLLGLLGISGIAGALLAHRIRHVGTIS
jgi:hypothetical protein